MKATLPKFKEFVAVGSPILFGGIGSRQDPGIDNDQVSESVILEDVSIEELSESLKKHYDIKRQEHITAIKKYTRDSSTLNSELWQAAEKKRQPILYKLDKPVHHELQDAIKNHITPHEMTVHTGLHKNPKMYINKKGTHTHFSFPAYTSTSIDKKVAERFATMHKDSNGFHVLSINVPKHTHGVYVEHHSSNTGEKEFILRPDAVIKVHHKPKLENGVYYWKGELVHDGIKHHRVI